MFMLMIKLLNISFNRLQFQLLKYAQHTRVCSNASFVRWSNHKSYDGLRDILTKFQTEFFDACRRITSGMMSAIIFRYLFSVIMRMDFVLQCTFIAIAIMLKVMCNVRILFIVSPCSHPIYQISNSKMAYQ